MSLGAVKVVGAEKWPPGLKRASIAYGYLSKLSKHLIMCITGHNCCVQHRKSIRQLQIPLSVFRRTLHDNSVSGDQKRKQCRNCKDILKNDLKSKKMSRQVCLQVDLHQSAAFVWFFHLCPRQTQLSWWQRWNNDEIRQKELAPPYHGFCWLDFIIKI